MALEEFETNEKLSPAERNKIILQLIDRFYPKEKLDFLNKSIQDRFILLQNESHLLNEWKEIWELDFLEKKIWGMYIWLDNLKDELKKFHEFVHSFRIYSTIKDAIIKNPDSENLDFVNLDNVYLSLKKQQELKERQQAINNRIFMNFKSHN